MNTHKKLALPPMSICSIVGVIVTRAGLTTSMSSGARVGTSPSVESKVVWCTIKFYSWQNGGDVSYML